MRSDLKLGKVFGIEVGLNYSWFLIAFVILYSFAITVHRGYPQWDWVRVGAWAIISTALFFGSLLAHELSHCMAANAFGIPVRTITLFALGGVTDIDTEPRFPAAEFWIAAAGPTMSGMIGVLLLGIAHSLSSPGLVPLATMLFDLGFINVSLALFNLLPAYPLDGGHILRALVWKITGDVDRSTRIAKASGQMTGTLLILGGLFIFLRATTFAGLWIALVGWFLIRSIREAESAARAQTLFQHLTVHDVMNRNCPSVRSDMSVAEFIRDELLRTGNRCYIVREHDRPIELITAHKLKALDQTEWDSTSLRTAMMPLDMALTVADECPILDAINLLSSKDITQMPVLKAGEVVGLLSRSDVLRFLKTCAEFGGQHRILIRN